MSRSMPILCDDVFPQSDNEVTTPVEKKKESAKRLHSPNSRSTEQRGKRPKDNRGGSAPEKREKLSHACEVSGDEGSSSRKTDNSKARHSSSKKTITPIKPLKTTSYDLFGTDSEGEDDSGAVVDSNVTAPPPLHSVFINRVASGLSKQVLPDKTGSHYVELKVYRSADIEHVMPINRWRHSVSSLKISTDMDSDLWQHLANVVSAARKEFRGTPNIFTSNFSMQL